jgi:hypothetical protein
MFVNISNHQSTKWDPAQRKAASSLAGDITDVSFPAVPPEADLPTVERMASETAAVVPASASHAMVQGEFTLCLALVKLLQERGIVCLAATTRRDVVEENGTKTAIFRFVRFREYSRVV